MCVTATVNGNTTECEGRRASRLRVTNRVCQMSCKARERCLWAGWGCKLQAVLSVFVADHLLMAFCRGFGRIMAHTAMVIMWPNDDGSITLSQRTAPREVMPTVVKNPPRIADVSAAGTYVSD